MEPVNLSDDGRVILPQPHEISKKEKDDAMGSYLMMFAAWAAGLPLPFLNIIAAVIYYFINKKESRFVAFHSHQSLITQFAVSTTNAVLIFWTIKNFFILQNEINGFNKYYFIYLTFVIIWNLVYTIYSLIACYKASKGKFFYMLLFGRFSFAFFYGKRAQTKTQKIVTNNPPSGF